MNRKKVKEQVKAILESKTLAEAYKKTHPNCTDKSAHNNSNRLLKNPDIVAELDKVLDSTKAVQVNRDNIVKLLTLVVDKWRTGNEKTSDFLRALELLSKLVPEFVDRHAINEYEKMSDDELDKAIQERYRQLGYSSGGGN